LEVELRHRLNRIEGHVRGIRRMLDAQEDCERLLVQIAAVKAALNQMTVKLLEGHMEMCVTAYMSTGDDQVLERLARALALVLKRA
jgi:DNA-binding FrmR family transcriptional regulator